MPDKLPPWLGELWRRLRLTVGKLLEDDGLQQAAAVSYYAALSFFPLLLILTSGFGLVLRTTGWGKDAQQQILDFVAEQASETLAQRVQEALLEVQSGSALNGPIGILSLLIASMAIFAQFETAFDAIWNVEPPPADGIVAKARRIVTHRLRAFLMLLGVGGLVVIGFVAGLVLTSATSLSDELFHLPSQFWNLVRLALTVLFNWGMFTIIYRMLPKVPVRWSEAAQGGLLASIIWELGRLVLTSVVIGNKYNAYGVIGSFIAILLWVYYATIVIFVGAEYVQVICGDCDE